MPSCATSQPAASSSARSLESLSNTGLELLTCTRILRFTASVWKAAIVPSAPVRLMCPILRPLLLPRPARIISSSRHKVPSNSTRSAPRIRDQGTHRILAQHNKRRTLGLFEVQRHLTGHGEAFDRQTAGRAVRQQERLRNVQGQRVASDYVGGQHIKNWIS